MNANFLVFCLVTSFRFSVLHEDIFLIISTDYREIDTVGEFGIAILSGMENPRLSVVEASSLPIAGTFQSREFANSINTSIIHIEFDNQKCDKIVPLNSSYDRIALWRCRVSKIYAWRNLITLANWHVFM